MIELGSISLDQKNAHLIVRRAVLRIADDLGFSTIDATRMAACASLISRETKGKVQFRLIRPGEHEQGRFEIYWDQLDQQAGIPEALFDQVEADGSFTLSKNLPLYTVFPDGKAVDGLKAIALTKSRQELMDDLKGVNQSLQKHQESLEETIAERTEEAESANRAKSEFLAHMSHEIRTPLNAIIGFSQILERDETLTPEQNRTVGTIARSGNHLLLLINDILEMSKIEAGQMTLNEDVVPLQSLARDLYEMMVLKTNEKGIAFDLEWDSALPAMVRTDPGKLRQIILNLLSNAVKFTEQGFVKLIFERVIDSEISEQPSLRVTISDTGPGISAEEQRQLFVAFFQSKSGRSSHSGTGLGLTISARFAEFLGGNLTLQSEVDVGSQFILRLPIQAEEGGAVSEVSRIDGEVIGLKLSPGQKLPRVLIAEDQPVNRELMDQLLRPVGFELQFAENGFEAVALVESWRPDFVWMDLKMPKMNGDEATTVIRQKWGSGLPVVALTASALSVERGALMESGFSEFVTKPIDPAVIFGTMAALLGIEYKTKEATEQRSQSTHESLSRLENWPVDFRTHFKNCIDLGDLSGINECIEQIRQQDKELAIAIEQPIANFAFDSIIAALNL